MDYKDHLIGKSESNFWFLAKKDLIRILLEKNLRSHLKNRKILSIGAGTGEELQLLKNFGEVYVIDIEKNALDLIPDNLYKEKRVCDACNNPYKDNFFDLVVAFDVFEHIGDDEKACSEVRRVIKNKGLLILTVPAFQTLFSAHDKALEHKRRYSKKDLRVLFKNFKTISLNYWNFFLFLPSAISRLMKRNATPEVDNPKFGPLISSLFYKLLKIENLLIKKGVITPPGITIIGVYKKI